MEWIILLLFVVLLLFGAKKIPEFARSLGKAKAEFQRGQMMVEREIREEQERYDSKKDKKKSKKGKKGKKQTSDIKKAAEALGIETEGKSDKELKVEIAKSVG
jgi:sec-independent protein translocase protein TatA